MTLTNKAAFALLITLMVLATVAYGAVHQPVIVIIYLLIAAMVVLWTIDASKRGTFRTSNSPIQLILLAAAVYGVIQVIPFGEIAPIAGVADIPRTISRDPFATSLASVHFTALFFFLAIALATLESAGRIRRMAAAITIFGFAFAFFAIIQSVLSPDKIYGIYEARTGASPFGSFVNRHNFAAFMEMSVALPLGMLFAGAVNRDKRLLYMTAAALMGAALLLSGSRGGLVAFLAQLIFLVFVTLGSAGKNMLLLRIGLAVLLFAAVVGGAYFVGGETSFTRIAETALSKDITTDRAHIWGVTLRVAADSLPLGAGLGAFGVAYTRFDSYSGLERVEQAHNDYLQVVADAGIPGLLIGLAFLYLLYRTGKAAVSVENRSRRGLAAGASAGIFAILVHSLFDFVLHTTAIALLFLLLIAILSATRYRYYDDLTDEQGPDPRRRRKHKQRVASFDSRIPG